MSDQVDLRHHGDAEAAAGLLDFAVNVAVPRPPWWLREALVFALDDVATYPDPTPAHQALATLHACRPESVLLTNGAAEAFTLVARAQPWRNPLVVHPQFTEPEAALVAAGHAVRRLILTADNGFRLDPADVDPSADLVVLGNPTNPTSRLHPRDAVLRLRRPGRLVVVDEAFMDVVTDGRQSVAADAVGNDGLLVIRSLTKTFGLAGVRAGYVLGTAATIDRLAAIQPHWSANSLAIAAAVACASRLGQDHAAEVATRAAANARYLADRLRDVGMEPVADPAGPFVLARHPRAARLREGLRQAGFAVRRGDTFPGLGPEWVRLAARDQAATDELVTAIAGELEQMLEQVP